MAVYTELTEKALTGFLQDYALGALLSFEGIAEGVENSNFLVQLTSGVYILTLFEKRVNAVDLPWFLGLMRHLAQNGVVCPQPVEGTDGQALRVLADRPAVFTTFLPGQAVSVLTPQACRQVGRALARLHRAGQGYEARRTNSLSVGAWPTLFQQCQTQPDQMCQAYQAHHNPLEPEWTAQIADFLNTLTRRWPAASALPVGHIHADLFPDNVFFQQGRLSGMIDFYFACTDFLAYDLAICLNAWGFEERGRDVLYRSDNVVALIAGYEQERPLDSAERDMLPLLCQGAALRFALTRLYDWMHTPADALVTCKNPRPYLFRCRHFAGVSHV